MHIHSAEQWARALFVFGILTPAACGVAGAQGYPATYDFGAPATLVDIAAVAIAIPADGTGLPAGKGDVAAGKRVYETACAACHGDRLQGVAGLPDMPSGPALRLIGGRGTLASKNPVLTVESYWPYATTFVRLRATRHAVHRAGLPHE
jgi:S-disulfanyl-L-cysteine oxidoreductase SoxD